MRQRSPVLAEIAWRWSFAAAAWALVIFTLYEYLRSLPVSGSDLVLLRTRHPFLVSQALAHILRGSGFRLGKSTIVVFLAVTILWIILASVGRSVTLKAILHSAHPETGAGSLLGLNFLRAALMVAAVLATLGALILAGFAAPAEASSPGVVANLALGLITLLWCLWSALNWLLSLGPIFVLREGQDTWGSISSAVEFVRREFGRIAAVNAVFFVVRVIGFVAATCFLFFLMGIMAQLEAKTIMPAFVVIGLFYLAFADLLYVARLGAYAGMAHDEPSSDRCAVRYVAAPQNASIPVTADPIISA